MKDDTNDHGLAMIKAEYERRGVTNVRVTMGEDGVPVVHGFLPGRIHTLSVSVTLSPDDESEPPTVRRRAPGGRLDVEDDDTEDQRDDRKDDKERRRG